MIKYQNTHLANDGLDYTNNNDMSHNQSIIPEISETVDEF